MPTKHRIHKPENLSYSEVQQKVEAGAQFVTYQYTISLLAITLRPLTGIYFIDAGEHPGKYAGTANTLSCIFGWWCIPWGPMRTLQSIALNKKGGVDVTNDVMVNLNEEDFGKGVVVIKEIYTPYHTPNKDESNGLRKSLEQFLQMHRGIERAYYALFVNVEEYQEPYFVIGIEEQYLDTQLMFPEEYVAELKKLLYKQFRKNAQFEFIVLRKDDPLSDKLIELDLVVTTKQST